MRVCMICEGCYPYVPGGVSGWIQMLCSEFQDVDFIVWSIATTREEMCEYAYQIPGNVKEIRTCYLGDGHFARSRRKAGLSRGGKEILRNLLMGPEEQIDWTSILEFIRKYRRRMGDVLMSQSFFEICLEEYKRQGSQKVFNHFLWNLRGIYFPLMQLLSEEIPQADIYHSVSTGYAGILGSCASYINGKPFLLSEHGIYTREREEDIIRSQWVAGDFKEVWIQFFKKLSYIAYRQARYVTTLFGVNRSLQIELNCPADKIVLIPNGVEAAEYDACRKEKRVGAEGFTIGAVLRVVPIKDVKTMLLTFDLVKQAKPGVRLKIMGNCRENPEYYEECMELLEELGTPDVEFLGQVNVKEHLPDIDLLVLSSISEGQPLAILEGMAAEIPFVATNVGNCRALLEGEEGDNLGPAGLVVPVMDSEAMADAIIRCIQNPGMRQAMGSTGRKRVERFYSRRAMLKAFYRLYEEMEAEKWQE